MKQVQATTLEARAAIAYRQAVYEDVPALVILLRQFVTSTKYREYVGASAEALQAFLEGILRNPSAVIFVAERDAVVIGLIGVLGYVHPMSGRTVAGELFWWLNPQDRGAGGWLLRRAENWARAYGASSLQMIAPAESPHVGAMYERLGYEAVETAYQVKL
jgi:GNAT superfamily N-acetyltransferase